MRRAKGRAGADLSAVKEALGKKREHCGLMTFNKERITKQL